MPQLKRSLTHPDSSLFPQKSGVNMASLLWLLLPAIVFPRIPVQGRTETPPACWIFPCTIILARQWLCWPPDCPSSRLKGDPGREISGRWACRYSLGTPLAAASSQQKIPASPRLHQRKPWMLPTPITLSCPRGALLTTLAFQTAILPFNCKPLPAAIPSSQLVCFVVCFFLK